jgi:hypothetical protein
VSRTTNDVIRGLVYQNLHKANGIVFTDASIILRKVHPKHLDEEEEEQKKAVNPRTNTCMHSHQQACRAVRRQLHTIQRGQSPAPCNCAGKGQVFVSTPADIRGSYLRAPRNAQRAGLERGSVGENKNSSCEPPRLKHGPAPLQNKNTFA